ncbi:MAG: hypothetical protein DWQ01_06000 [Planctomycetota bacterium]|nr:MAG: hypothetical protein DWQ01_06000 [Planctomycetota bacterium]
MDILYFLLSGGIMLFLLGYLALVGLGIGGLVEERKLVAAWPIGLAAALFAGHISFLEWYGETEGFRWRQARSSIEKLEAYQKDFPEGEYFQESVKRLATLRAERAERLAKEMEALRQKNTPAAKLRLAALENDSDKPSVILWLKRAGRMRPASREFPGHKYAKHSDYLPPFEEYLRKRVETGTGVQVILKIGSPDLPLGETGVSIVYEAVESGRFKYTSFGGGKFGTGYYDGLRIALSAKLIVNGELQAQDRLAKKRFSTSSDPTWEGSKWPLQVLCEDTTGKAMAAFSRWFGHHNLD